MSRSFLARLGAIAAAIATWHALGTTWPAFVATPVRTFRHLAGWLASGELVHHASYTLLETLAGFFIGALPGVALPLLLRRAALVRAILAPFASAAYGLPKLALAPLFVVWLGVGLTAKITLVASVVFFHVFYMTTGGVEAVSPSLVATARVLGARERRILVDIVWPTTLPYTVTGLRVAVPHAVGAAIVGELVSSNRGLGYLLHASAADFDAAGVFAGVVVIAALVAMLDTILTRLERRWLAWRRPTPLRVEATTA